MIESKRVNQYLIENQRGPHKVLSDVLPKLGGNDEGLNPHELLEAALASCTSMTIQMYANRKQWALESADVKVHVVSEGPQGAVIQRSIHLQGQLNDEEKQRLMEIADKCPLHKLLSLPIKIETVAS